MKRKLIAFGFLAWCSMASHARAEEFDRGSEKRSKRRLAKLEDSDMPRFEKRAKRNKDYMNYLPFGAGQFMQKKTWLGTGLAATQAGALVLYYARLSQVESANADATSVMNASGAQGNGNATLLMFMDQNEKVAREARESAQMYLFTFVGLYAFGVVDAVYDPFNTSSFVSRKKNRSTRTAENDKSRSEKDGLTKERERKSRKRFSFIVSPSDKKPSYGLSMASDF